jgi:epoxyqueuosine reductase QueG
VAVAERAGLGAAGYHGLLIAPASGARLRIGTVYTDIENLPVPASNPHAWVRDFCAGCRRCVRSCPPGAILDSPRPRPGGGATSIDSRTCNDFFSVNHGCAVCVKVCPFSHAGYDVVKAGHDVKAAHNATAAQDAAGSRT